MMVREKIVEENAHDLLRIFEGVVHSFLQKDSSLYDAGTAAETVVLGAVNALVSAAEEDER